MSKALYRKYRPLQLSDVIGQEHITNNLANSLAKQQFSHAYLFTGPRGTGKTSVARIFAHAVNNFNYELEDSHLDIIEIDAASNTGVENIRELREKAIIAPSYGKYKVYIIDEVHMLSKSAFNALLKTLEEPPEHTIFILATTDVHKVPITITSRVQVFNFRLVDIDIMTKHLEVIAKQEGIIIDQPALQLIARRSGGSFRDALSLLDQIRTLNQKITLELLLKAFGLPSDQLIDQLISYAYSKDHHKIHQNLTELYQNNVRPEIIIEELVRKLTENYQPELNYLLERLIQITPPFIEVKLLLSLIPTHSSEDSSITAIHNKPLNKIQNTPKITTDEIQIEKKSQKSINSNSKNFSWSNFIEQITKQKPILGPVISSCKFKLSEDTLIIQPQTHNNHKFITSTTNQRFLANLCPLKLIINEVDQSLLSSSPLSDIMGPVEEVINGGEIPF